MKSTVLVCLVATPLMLCAKERTAPEHLSLAQAEAIALSRAPQIEGAYFQEEAARQGIREARAGFFPQVTAEATAVGTGVDLNSGFGQTASPKNQTRIGATGGLNDPTILSRQSNGLIISQLVTDFGRTARLTSAFRLQALSEAQKTQLARTRVVLSVDEAYFKALQAQSVLRVASEVVEARKLLFDQISVLAKNNLKSGLDVSVAKVSLGEGNLLLLQAQDNVEKAFADLSAALGYQDMHKFSLAEEPVVSVAEGTAGVFVRQGLERRPDVLAIRHQRDAAWKFASAEGAARYPKITAMGAVGTTPFGDDRVTGNYAAAGVNIELPIFDGGRLSARYQEATFKAKVVQKAVEEAEQGVARDITVAWLNTINSLKKIEVTRELDTNASEALDLARSRYSLGSVSIIELSQAQLDKTQAEIAYASAKYGYQISRAELDFETGALSSRLSGKNHP